jgi:hypothetical protein
MTSKHPNQSSRRYPLKRVRPDNENQSSIISSNGRPNKKLRRQPSEGLFQIYFITIKIEFFLFFFIKDSAFVEIEKSSDERAFDLFYK